MTTFHIHYLCTYVSSNSNPFEKLEWRTEELYLIKFRDIVLNPSLFLILSFLIQARFLYKPM
jgi:hypothetical protein